MGSVYYSIGTGDFTDTAIWSLTVGGGTAGVYPQSGDTAYIQPSHTVTISTNIAIGSFFCNGGDLVINAGLTITFDNNVSSGLRITSTNSGGVAFNGTCNSPVIFTSAAATPTYPYTIIIANTAAIDTRTFSFGVCHFQKIKPTLGYYVTGSSLEYLVFNNPITFTGPNSGRITNITPLSRQPIIVEHEIDGRPYSRVYQRGSKAGTITINGTCRWDSFMYESLLAMQAANVTLAFFGEYVQLPRCRFAQKPSFQPKPGSLYCPFSITLIEDR
jgi:hypothetical protein